jgi:hypothetical protein
MRGNELIILTQAPVLLYGPRTSRVQTIAFGPQPEKVTPCKPSLCFMSLFTLLSLYFVRFPVPLSSQFHTRTNSQSSSSRPCFGLSSPRRQRSKHPTPCVLLANLWPIITDSRHLPAWSNVSRHVMNARLTLFEILFTQSVPGPLAHLIPRVLILICYLGVTYIMRATQASIGHSLGPGMYRLSCM